MDENYLDRLLEGYTLKLVTNRFINELDGVTYLIDNKRLQCIILGIGNAIKHRDLYLHFEWEYGRGVSLHNYKPNFDRGCGHEECCSPACKRVLILGNIESDKCIVVGLKINETKIECHDYSP